MLDILREAISSRKGCTAYYPARRPKAKTSRSSSDAGHAFCISVLESTLSTLEVKLTDTVHNADIHLIETCVSTLGLAKCSAEASEKSQLLDNAEDYTAEPTAEDAEFALFCMLKDATDIRVFVRRTWREHKAGAITLETVAVTMNVAISIFE
jgi:hypothetical protein